MHLQCNLAPGKGDHSEHDEGLDHHGNEAEVFVLFANESGSRLRADHCVRGREGSPVFHRQEGTQIGALVSLPN